MMGGVLFSAPLCDLNRACACVCAYAFACAFACNHVRACVRPLVWPYKPKRAGSGAAKVVAGDLVHVSKLFLDVPSRYRSPASDCWVELEIALVGACTYLPFVFLVSTRVHIGL